MEEKGVPNFTLEQAQKLVDVHYGLTVRAWSLPSYIDQNFKIRDKQGRLYVLKLANRFMDRDVLDFQHAAMIRLDLAGISVPTPLENAQREMITEVKSSAGESYLMHLVTWLPGHFVADIEPHSDTMLESLGHFLGRMDMAYQGFEHQAMDRDLIWDLRHALKVRPFLAHIDGLEDRKLVSGLLDRFEQVVIPNASLLRMSVIHNDANDYNVLTTRGCVSGVIDFGDQTRTWLVNELAIACAYMMLNKAEPLKAALGVVHGYFEVFKLRDIELKMLFELIRTRLCVSVCMSARQASLVPDNAYLKVTERSAWRLLYQLVHVHPDFAWFSFREACGLPPSPTQGAVIDWIRNNSGSPVFESSIWDKPRVVFDFKADVDDMAPDESGSPEAATRVLFAKMDVAGAGMGLGKYDEVREVYKSPGFVPDDGSEARTVHIGVDLFVNAGTPLLAPYDSVVHSFNNNDANLDYGPTIILEHAIPQGSFYTLYGHLSVDSLDGIAVGQKIAQGEAFARIGDYPVNGNWSPHLHFQVMTHLFGKEGDFPGVCTQSGRELWKQLCPDPNLILQLPELSGSGNNEALIQARKAMFGRNLSISYKKALKIVRGRGQYLYDDAGRAYLDMVNNVCHVGHCHPRVVAAVNKQMSQLNTNTRYLHDNLVEYITRLTALFPDPLNVCFLTCTGSEANDLALRLARTHTGGHDVVVVDGAYHGHTNELIQLSPYKYEGQGGKGRAEHVQQVKMPDPYRGTFKGASSGPLYANDVAEALQRIQARGSKPAAFFCESLLGCGGQIVLPSGYLEESFALVREAGGVCIADEVQVGFGRVGTHVWGFETQGVVPDIVTLGKPIGNGHPMAAVITTAEIAASFDNGMEYFNTFGGNPVSCAAGLAVLDVIEDERLQANAHQIGSYLVGKLQEMKSRHTLIGDVRGIGLFIGIELVRDHDSLEPADNEASVIVEKMKDRGILLSTDGPLHNVIKIKPPLVFNQDDADLFLSNLDQVLSETV